MIQKITKMMMRMSFLLKMKRRKKTMTKSLMREISKVMKMKKTLKMKKVKRKRKNLAK